MSYTDADFSGLMLVADDGLRKEAADYGNLPELSTGNAVADLGLYMVPFVGEGMAAYDAARNFSDSWSDFKRGKLLAGLGNLGSGAINTLFAIPGIGTAGRWLKGIFKGGKMVAKGAKGATRASRVAQEMAQKAIKARGMQRAEGVGTGLWSSIRHPFASSANRAIDAANAARPGVWGTYRNLATARDFSHMPKFHHAIMGQMGGELLKGYDDSRYDANMGRWLQGMDERVYGGHRTPNPDAYSPWSTFDPSRPAWDARGNPISYNQYGRPFGYGQQGR